MKPLTPPDLNRCQAEQRVGVFQCGGRIGEMSRCKSAPVAVVTERKPGSDGQRGSMSLCEPCLAVAKRQLGASYFTVKRLRKSARDTR